MGACTFFGHRDAPACVKQDIQNAVMRLIKEHGIRRFYVGNHGHFDTYVQDILLQLKAAHPDIDATIVLAYYPSGQQTPAHPLGTVYPDGLENTPFRYAIDKRNTWMLSHSDFVICFLRYHTSGAARYVKKAEKMGKTIIYL